MVTELEGLPQKTEDLAKILLGDCLLRKEEEPAGTEERTAEEILRPYRQCCRSVEMNICVVGDSRFRTCLLKHGRPYFSRTARGLLLAERFVQAFAVFLDDLGGGDPALGRMRLSLYAGEIETALKRHLEEGLLDL